MKLEVLANQARQQSMAVDVEVALVIQRDQAACPAVLASQRLGPASGAATPPPARRGRPWD